MSQQALLITAQAVGCIAMVISFLSFQGNSKKHILLFQLASCTLFGAHYLLLSFAGESALTGAVLNFTTVARDLIFYLGLSHKWAESKAWKIAFAVIYVVIGIVTWDAWYSILPVIGILCSTLAFIPKSTTAVRILHLPSSPCWLIYNVINFSIPGIITECFTLVSLAIAFVRFDILGKKKSAGEAESADKA